MLRTRMFNSPMYRTTWASRYQKGRTNLDFTEARDNEWQWHQLGCIQVCISLQTDNHVNTPPLSFYRPDALPAAQPTASKHWRHSCLMLNSPNSYFVFSLSMLMIDEWSSHVYTWRWAKTWPRHQHNVLVSRQPTRRVGRQNVAALVAISSSLPHLSSSIQALVYLASCSRPALPRMTVSVFWVWYFSPLCTVCW